MTPAAADPPIAGSRPAARAAASITRTTRGRPAAQNAIRISVPACPGSPARPTALAPPGTPSPSSALPSPGSPSPPAALPPAGSTEPTNAAPPPSALPLPGAPSPPPGCPFAAAQAFRAAGQPHQAGGDGRAAAPPPSSEHSSPARSAVASGSPSSSTATRTGAPRAARSISTADGARPLPAAAATVRYASSAPGQSTVTYVVDAGSGWSRNTASTISPSVPNDPVNSLPRSYPATFLTTFPPDFATVPSARTTVIPMIRSRGVP